MFTLSSHQSTQKTQKYWIKFNNFQWISQKPHPAYEGDNLSPTKNDQDIKTKKWSICIKTTVWLDFGMKLDIMVPKRNDKNWCRFEVSIKFYLGM